MDGDHHTFIGSRIDIRVESHRNVPAYEPGDISVREYPRTGNVVCQSWQKAMTPHQRGGEFSTQGVVILFAWMSSPTAC